MKDVAACHERGGASGAAESNGTGFAIRQAVDLERYQEYIVKAIVVWSAIMITIALYRTAWMLYELGWRETLRNAFRIETDAWRLIAVLIFVAIAFMLAYTIPLGWIGH